MAAQVFSSPCMMHLSIPDNGCGKNPLIYDFEVNGLQGVFGEEITLERVDVLIEHSWNGDVSILLQSPFGIEVELSSGNGAGGNHYGNPKVEGCRALASFSRAGSGSTAFDKPPFVGEFFPQGDLNDFHKGKNPNGIWKLMICDAFQADIGKLHFVRLVFAPAESVLTGNAGNMK